ncbi:MAG: M23 family metallopeptidase [Thermodesulfovibrionia bacterium]
MNGFGHKRRRKGRLKRLGLILSLPFIIIIITYLVYKLFFAPPPSVEGIEAFNLLSADKSIRLTGKNLKSIDIFIKQGDKNINLLRDIAESSEKIYTLQVKPRDLGLTDGSAKVFIKARAGILKEVKYEIDSMIDTVPPALEVLKAPPIIYQGTVGFVQLKAKDADSVFVKIVVPTPRPAPYGSGLRDQTRENQIFKAFKATSETDSAPASVQKKGVHTYFVFFPAPFDIEEGSVFYAVAKDVAGNQILRALPTKLKTRKFKTSQINIDDTFINTVVAPLLNKTDIPDPAGAFKMVNEEWRKSILKRLLDIARETESDILWNGRFTQLKNSKVMAKYGDKRIYLYNGEAISKSVHLGYDLASVTNASVEAANSGVIRFAEDLGIYGNTVIIDHGLGLMSIYGHLSSIMVEQGQPVKKGDVIAKTGSTGLAGGDHLHFGILIHGHEVSPLHWWDRNWIKVNVLDYLEQ